CRGGLRAIRRFPGRGRGRCGGPSPGSPVGQREYGVAPRADGVEVGADAGAAAAGHGPVQAWWLAVGAEVGVGGGDLPGDESPPGWGDDAAHRVVSFVSAWRIRSTSVSLMRPRAGATSRLLVRYRLSSARSRVARGRPAPMLMRPGKLMPSTSRAMQLTSVPGAHGSTVPSGRRKVPS